MSESESRTCPSCGARLDAGADVCDLCGTAAEEGASIEEEKPVEGPHASTQNEGPYCNQCGWQNPVDANFCSQCGTRLQEVAAGQTSEPSATESVASSPPPPPSSDASGKQRSEKETEEYSRRKRIVGILVGASVLVVLALFLLLVYGQQDGDPGAQPPASSAFEQTPAQSAMPTSQADTQSVLSAENREPLSAPFAGRADSLKQLIVQASASDEARQRRELVSLYVEAGRADLAALQEHTIAENAGTPEAWTSAGDRFYEWMMSASGPEKANVAQVAANAYERVLRQQPENHDVRARLGWTYLQTRQNPMRGIQEIKRVIDEDPDHIPARMNYGIALAQIGRFEKSIKQFEHVQSLSEEGSPRFQQARQIIQNIRRQMEGGSS